MGDFPAEYQESLHFLESAGIPSGPAKRFLIQARGDVGMALELYENSLTSAPTANPNTGRQPGSQQIIPHPSAGGNAGEVDPTQLAASLLGQLKQVPTNRTSTTTDEEAELRRVLELSKQTATGTAPEPSSEDQVLARVLEESKKTAGVSAMDVESGVPGFSSDEMQLAKALEASFQSSGVDSYSLATVSNNPNHRKREDGVPVGLRNVGNTCYFNSLLQTYFFIPELRRAVLRFPPLSELSEEAAKSSTAAFMVELQRLFAYMLLTNQKWVDPTPLLKKLMDKNGEPINIGNQEDVSEFNELFLTRITEGLELTSSLSQSKQSCKEIKQMFHGTAIEFLNAKESDGTPIETSQDGVVIAHLILPVSEQPEDLYTCLDHYMTDKVEYATEKGHKTVAVQSRWFTKLPAVLMIQQNRVKFNIETNTYHKLSTPVRFDNEIAMDRYFLEHRQQTTEAREVVNQWRAELNKLEAEIRAITHFKGRSHGLDEALRSVIDYLTDKLNATQPPDPAVNPSIELLNQYYKAETERLGELNEEARKLRNKIESAYDDFPKDAKYSLYAVWVHAGVAGSGHYWSYLRTGVTKKQLQEAQAKKASEGEGDVTKKYKEVEDMKDANSTTQEMKGKDKVEDDDSDKVWLKSNDIRITFSDEESMLQEAVGGYGTSTAYFLIYVESDTFKRLQETHAHGLEQEAEYLTSDMIRKEIEEDNNKFLETLEKYNKSSTSDKVATFLNTVGNKQAEAQQYVEDAVATAGEKDFRIKSFYAWLYSIGFVEQMTSEIIKDVFVTTFERGIHLEVGTSYYTQIQEKLGAAVEHALTSALDGAAVSETLRAEHQSFRKVAQFFSVGLTFFFEQKYDKTFHAFAEALMEDRKQQYPSARRDQLIMGVVRVCLLGLFEEASKMYAAHDWGSINLFSRLASYAGAFLELNEPVYISIRDRLFTLAQSSLANIPSPDARERLENCVRSMLSGAKPTVEIIHHKLTEIGRSELDKWADLATRIQQQLQQLKEAYPGLCAELLPQPPASPSTSSASSQKPAGGAASQHSTERKVDPSKTVAGDTDDDEPPPLVRNA
ncbi:Ubiquitin carboxyl-terminal hydrolase 28 [Balamuthia mandrillaris]